MSDVVVVSDMKIQLASIEMRPSSFMSYSAYNAPVLNISVPIAHHQKDS